MKHCFLLFLFVVSAAGASLHGARSTAPPQPMDVASIEAPGEVSKLPEPSTFGIIGALALASVVARRRLMWSKTDF